MRKKKFIFCFLVIIFLFNFLFAKNIKRIPIKKLFDFNPIMKKMKLKQGFFTYPSRKYFVKDKYDNFYLLNSPENRIIKLSKKGKILRIIGHFGTDKYGFYYPGAIDIYNSILYVATSSIKKTVLKGFDLDGKKIVKIIEFSPEGDKIRSLLVEKNFFYVNLRIPIRKNNNNDLITVFNSKGKKIFTLGKPVKTQSWVGNMYFNMGLVSKYKNSIVGALLYYPIIFHYKTNGEKIYYKNLLKEKIPEILEIEKFVIKNNIDRPEKRFSSGDGQISYVHYCYAADIDKNLNLYYSTWALKNNIKAPVLPVVYVFNKDGEKLSKLVFTLNGNPVKVCYLLIDKTTGKRYGIGFIGSIGTKNIPIFLFEF